jgi:alanyl-tRNA synthetase
VFIQFNANADGTFSPLAAKHVDTGMGFERVAGIHATTNGFTDFSKDPSNYAADIFAPLFGKIAHLSGKRYQGTVPKSRTGLSEQENVDIAFRVLADHARCVSCSIADGILPGNEGRNYVIRRILRRGILYGKKLGLRAGFFEQLVDPVVESLGGVFPELGQRKDIIHRVIRSEEESFGRTLDRGLEVFSQFLETGGLGATGGNFPGADAFVLYDTYGFPLDMTQLLAAERGLSVDTAGFELEMDKQRSRGRAAQKKEIVVAATEGDAAREHAPTSFVGYSLTPSAGVHARVVDVVNSGKDSFLVFDQTPFYAEMGGQAGDSGSALVAGRLVTIVDTVKDKAGRHLHKAAEGSPAVVAGEEAELLVDLARRRAISRHHSATHLLHWALRKVLGTHIRQAGTHKTPDRLRFDFSHFEAVTAAQLREVEGLVNERVIDNSSVSTYEVEFDKKPADTLAFFGDKYGRIVRVVDIGGFSRELCGGTHVATAGEIGFVKVVHESAIAAGTRRIEAVAGRAAQDFIAVEEAALSAVNAHLSSGPTDVVRKLESLLAQKAELEKKLKVFEHKASASLAGELASKATTRDGLTWVSAAVVAESAEALRALGAQVLSKIGEGVVVLGAAFGEKASVVAFCSPAAIQAGHSAGKLVNELSLKLGGKGGGKPDFAMGGGRDVARLAEVLNS